MMFNSVILIGILVFAVVATSGCSTPSIQSLSRPIGNSSLFEVVISRPIESLSAQQHTSLPNVSRSAYNNITYAKAEINITCSTSMLPAMKCDENPYAGIVTDFNELKTGDIILFRTSILTENYIHRIYDVAEDHHGVYYRTKGDNNNYIDPQIVRSENIQYKIVGRLR